MRLNKLPFLFVMVTTANLTACENNDFTDLQRYMDGVKARPKSAIKPLPNFQIVEPFIFKGDANLRDPFKLVEKNRLAQNGEQEEGEIEPDNGIHPDVNRTKEPLEAFPLSSLKMVGTFKMNSILWGLIKGEGNTIYRVKKGDYLGANDGKIISIEKNKIELLEIMPSNPGRFIEQSTSLTLAE
jgi:type IV pilus assembly protein PilP